jgi:hypothetical protein
VNPFFTPHSTAWVRLPTPSLLLIAGFVLKISILWTIGIIGLVIGAILMILGSTGRAVGGRRHYF